jgi:hypothetical protein
MNCCNKDCNQGRDCPARETSADYVKRRNTRDDLWAAGVYVVLLMGACVLIAEAVVMFLRPYV